MSQSVENVETAFDPRVFRDAMGHYPTGVVVVTAMIDENPVGMVVGTFSSVSLDPPLVSFMPMTTSATYAQLREAENLCISVFAHDQLKDCSVLASKDPDKFDRVEWTMSPAGAPMLTQAVAHIHGTIDREVEAGDHYITLVAVDNISVNRAVTPLLFFQGGYGGFSTTGLSAHVDESLISAVRVGEAARPQLNRLAQKFSCSAAALVQVSAVDQTIASTSYGGTSEADERIGIRIPLIPPLGEAAVAWSPDQVDEWVKRIPRGAEQTADEYREVIEKVKEQGYAISRLDQDPEGYEVLGEALAEYAGGEMTPAVERKVLATIAGAGANFGGSVSPDEQNIDLASVVVPVFDPNEDTQRNSGLVIRLGHLPQGVSGDTVLGWVKEMQLAAEDIRRTLGGTAEKVYQRYNKSNLRNN